MVGTECAVGLGCVAVPTGRRGGVAGDDPLSTMLVTGRDRGQGGGRRVVGPRRGLCYLWVTGSPCSAALQRRGHRPEADGPIVQGRSHPGIPAPERRPVPPFGSEHPAEGVGPKSARDMEASFVEWSAGCIESVPVVERPTGRPTRASRSRQALSGRQSATCARTQVIAGGRRRGPLVVTRWGTRHTRHRPGAASPCARPEHSCAAGEVRGRPPETRQGRCRRPWREAAPAAPYRPGGSGR